VRSTWKLIALLVGSSSVAACTFEEADTSTDRSELIGENLNGRSLNGRVLNGTNLGETVQFASTFIAWLDTGPSNVWLDGSQLVGRSFIQWRAVAGADFEGALFSARSDTGKHVWLRVADVIEPAAGSSVWRYAIEFRHQNDWFPMCLADALTGEGLNGPLLNGDSLNEAIANGDVIALPSIPVDGYWNFDEGVAGGGRKIESLTRITFACTQIGAIGKCVEAGYRPWEVSDDGMSLAASHEACVRLLRADYCGDGTPHTVDGVWVNVYDFAGVQDDTEAWGVEAEWNADGARCVTANHRQAQAVACYDELYDPTCGNPADWAGGTLVVSEIE
jgi:hypothetical protein